MADTPGGTASAKVDALVYTVYLAGFLVLLFAASQIFGGSLLALAFGLFIVVVVAAVAALARLLG